MFAVLGVLLVLVMFVFNFTVTDGTINGFICYVNIAGINDSIFFPLHQFSYVFISIVNLDLGIQTCFYNTMDDYAKMWLQLVFPLYLILIAVLLIIASRHCTKVQRLTARRALPVLATLFLLSYTKILRTVSNVLFSYSTVNTLLYLTNLFPFSRTWSYSITEILIATFTSPIVSFGQNSYSVVNFLILIALFLALIVLTNVATEFLRNRVLRTTRLTIGTQEVIAIFSRYALLSIGTIVLLQAWGIQLSSLAILASALGVGIGFGFQNIAKDFGSGFVLLLERAIQVGDFVQVGDYMGTVERIDPRFTLIRTLDSISIIVPNSRFLDLEVINWSHSNPISRLRIPVGVSYHANVNAVRRALLEAAKKHGDVLSHPEPVVGFTGFGDSALNFVLLVWIRDPVQQLGIKSDLYFLIEAVFKQHKIEIPFPQRDLHLRSGTLPLQVSPELEQILSQLSQQLTNNNQ